MRAALRKISLIETLKFAVVFPARNLKAVALRVALPALAGWAVLYASAYLYLSELRSYLGLPSDRSGSIILGLVAAGLLLLLLLHATLTSAVATLAMGRTEDGQSYFRAKRREWRLYAANLRVLLVIVFLVAAVIAVRLSLGDYDVALVAPLSNLVIVVGVFVLLARCVFLAPPIVSVEGSGPIVRRAAFLSKGNFWRISMILVILSLPGFLIEVVGEKVLRAVGIFPSVAGPTTFNDVLVIYSHILPGILVLVAIAYLVNVLLVTIASVAVYRQLAS